MVYNFDLKTVAPIIQGLLTPEPQEDKPIQPLPLLTEQPVISEQPEQRGGTAMVNAAMENAIPQAPNSFQTELRRGLLLSKNDYANAKDDAARQAAHNKAELYRNQATAAGLDLSDYGSDVSLADATKNLASQQARDIMGAMQGYYSKNSGQYYNDKYFKGIELGLSPRRARKAAKALTDNYQADRVQYLDGLLNSYGRDGLVMNEYGNQILGMMAHEDPMLASFYAGIYPNAKDAFSRYNTLEDKGIDQRNRLEQLAVGNEYDLDRIKAQTAGNIELANNNFRNTVKRDEIQQGYTRQNAYDQYRFSYYLARNKGEIDKEATKLQADLNRGNLEYLKKLDVDLEDKKFWQGVAQYSALADYLGYKDEGKKAFMEAVFGIKMPNEKTGAFDKASIENGKKLHDMLDADEKNILKQAENELDPQKVMELQAKLADIRQFKQQIENLMGEQLGVQGGVQEFSDDETANNETLNYLWSQSNGNVDTFKQYVSNWLDASGVTAHFKEQYLRNLKTPQ